jgi:hypothetical protein
MRPLAEALIVLALVCALVVPTGCDAGAENADSPPTRAVFVHKANNICKAARVKFVAAAVPIVKRGPKPGESQYEVELGVVHSLLIPMLVKEIRDLRELGSPRGEKADLAGLLRGIHEALEEARNKPQTYIVAGGHYVYGRIHYATANKYADKLGLAECPQR